MKWRQRRAANLLSMALLLVGGTPDHEAQAQVTSDSIVEIRHATERVLAEKNTLGASVAIVRRGEPPWVAGFGAADLATGRVASSETLFRIGSVSKPFVALAVLVLVDRGRLSLNDPVRTLVPEIRFDNAWESSDPVRVVHLLEHTTGWDDIHLRDYAKDGSSM